MKREALRLIKMTWNELLPCKSCVGSLSLPIRLQWRANSQDHYARGAPGQTCLFKSWRGGAQIKTKGRSLGVEHANFEDLEKALAGLVGSYEDENFFDITKTDLMRLGLLMGSDSHQTTEYLGEALRIGFTVASNCSGACRLFGICLAKSKEAMASC